MKPLALILALLLAGCGDPPCHSEAAAEKAAEAFKRCVLVVQHGTGGFKCGVWAYETFCQEPDLSFRQAMRRKLGIE